jgi:branched-chain amino acid transport system ATP-binding protein
LWPWVPAFAGTSGSGATKMTATTPLALSTRGLSMSFGSLVVARDIELSLPAGARYALIGPNGAGKTTLINLMTGMLAPKSGQIFLGDEDVTALAPQQRVRRGLARTFQINTLFPGLNALEAVTLAVAERRGIAGRFWQNIAVHGEAIEEAYEILVKLKLGDSCYQPTRELPYGRQRLLEIALALASKPKVLLLDEPAAGVPQDESGDIFEVVAGLSDDLTLLFIEHDMHVVFRFASHIFVLVGGALFAQGSPQEIAADPGVREVYLGKRKHG